MGHHHKVTTQTCDEYSSGSNSPPSDSGETKRHHSPVKNTVNQNNYGMFQNVNQPVQQSKEKTTCCEWIIGIFKS